MGTGVSSLAFLAPGRFSSSSSGSPSHTNSEVQLGPDKQSLTELAALLEGESTEDGLWLWRWCSEEEKELNPAVAGILLLLQLFCCWITTAAFDDEEAFSQLCRRWRLLETGEREGEKEKERGKRELLIQNLRGISKHLPKSAVNETRECQQRIKFSPNHAGPSSLGLACLRI